MSQSIIIQHHSPPPPPPPSTACTGSTSLLYLIYKNQSVTSWYLIHAKSVRDCSRYNAAWLLFLLSLRPLPDRCLTLSKCRHAILSIRSRRLQLLLDLVRHLLTRFASAVSGCRSCFLHVVSSLLPLILSLFAATSSSNLELIKNPLSTVL